MEDIIKQIRLEKMKLTILQAIRDDLIDGKVDISEYTSFIEDSIVMRIKGYLYGEDGEKVIIKYPNSWYQMFKEKYFPNLLIDKFPIKYKVFEITPRTIYPKFKISMPNEKNHLIILSKELI